MRDLHRRRVAAHRARDGERAECRACDLRGGHPRESRSRDSSGAGAVRHAAAAHAARSHRRAADARVIAALLLAAGASRRFGAAKLLQDLDGKAVVRWSAESLLQAPVDEIIVVVAPAEAVAARAALNGLTLRFESNARAAEGRASSIATGVATISPKADAVLVALGDEPRVDPSVARAVIEKHRNGGATIVAPTF